MTIKEEFLLTGNTNLKTEITTSGGDSALEKTDRDETPQHVTKTGEWEDPAVGEGNLESDIEGNAAEDSREAEHVLFDNCTTEDEEVHLEISDNDIGKEQSDKAIEISAKNKTTGTKTLEKKFSCDTCDKRFCTKLSLMKHMELHPGEKPHTCDICKKTFQ